jgi:hypothetical protein
MELEFKPDFERTRQQWDALRRGTNTRPLVLMDIPKPGLKGVAEPPRYMSWFDGPLEPVVDQLLAWAETHEFLGESVPSFCLHFGADTMAGYLGGNLKIEGNGSGGSWAVPFIEDWDRQEIRFCREGHWWQRTLEFGQALRARCDGKLLIAGPPLAANLDVLAAIRGSENLLLDLMTCPDTVKRALDAVCRAHAEIIQGLAELLDWDTLGSVNNEGTYCRGRHARPQCDLSCMISTDMFREFVMPCLQREAEVTDGFVYHLDGPGAIRHVPALCELEKLELIAYVPGQPGQPGRDEEQSLHTKIDSLGKGQLLLFSSLNAGETFGLNFGWGKDKIKRICKTLKSKKLVFQASVSSKTEAEDLLGELESLG